MDEARGTELSSAAIAPPATRPGRGPVLGADLLEVGNQLGNQSGEGDQVVCVVLDDLRHR